MTGRPFCEAKRERKRVRSCAQLLREIDDRRAGEARYYRRMRTYFVYLMASRSRVLYVGVTNDLTRRASEHKRGLTAGFTSRYHITRLVYFEELADIRDAIVREKESQGWVRSRKLAMIERRNPTWEDLAEKWFQRPTARS